MPDTNNAAVKMLEWYDSVDELVQVALGVGRLLCDLAEVREDSMKKGEAASLHMMGLALFNACDACEAARQ